MGTSWGRTGAVLAIALGVCGAASAQDLSGAWKFVTTENIGSCTISGDITFRAASRPRVYACEFISVAECPVGGVSRMWKVRQTCEASVNDAGVTITSKVDRIVDAAPPAMRDATIRRGGYTADHFALTPSGPSQMLGKLISRNSGRVRFWRPVERLS